MASRFYFPATLAAQVTPVADGAWGFTSEAVVRHMPRGKSNSALADGTRVGPWTAGQTALDRRYVSSPLVGAQTVSGTVSVQLMTREWATSDNSTSRLEIYVVSNDGQTVRGTCLAIGQYGPTTEYINNTSLRNKTFADGDAITTVNALDGDRIVVAVGHSDAAGSTPEATCKFGDPTATSDLPVNETQTTAGVGWIEFSPDWIVGDKVSPGGIASAEAFGTPSVTSNTQTVSPPAIAPAEEFGSHKLNLNVVTTSISSVEVFGTAKLSLSIVPSSISSAETIGSPTLTQVTTVSPSAIASAESFGTAKLSLSVVASSISSTEAFGSPNVGRQDVSVSSIAPAEAFGVAKLNLSIAAAGGIASIGALGSPTVTIVLVVSPPSISSIESFGTAKLNLSITPAGVASAGALGAPRVSYPDLAIVVSAEQLVARAGDFRRVTARVGRFNPDGSFASNAADSGSVRLYLFRQEPAGAALVLLTPNGVGMNDVSGGGSTDFEQVVELSSSTAHKLVVSALVNSNRPKTQGEVAFSPPKHYFDPTGLYK